MADMVLDVQVLPETVFSRIPAGKVRVREENDSIILTPVAEEKRNFDVIFGMFSDGKISTEEYMREKRLEKEFENCREVL